MLSPHTLRRAPAILLALVLCLAVFASAVAQSGTYTVQPGDRLVDIAAAHGVSLAALIRANNLANPDLIRTGQRLIIPGAKPTTAPTATPTPTAKPTATIAATITTTITTTVSSPASARPAPTATPATPRTYTVQRGDTLSGIAARFGVSAAALMSANNLASADLVITGQRLVIPPAGSSPAATPAASQPGKSSSVGTRFVVSISKQHCWLYQNGVVTGSWPCSTARRGWGTAVGTFKVQSKIPVAYGSTWGFFMPYWLGIYYSGNLENGIHGLPYNKFGYKDWGNKIGTPISFGCIVMQDAAARAVYNAAYIGMPVVIQR